MSLIEIRKAILKQRNTAQAIVLQRFFKTGKGEYGEGDIFYGIKVPEQRIIAKQFKDLPLDDLKILLLSKVHEERLISAFILVDQYEKGDDKKKKSIFDFYLKNRKGINNWDLVDLSSPKIIGAYLIDKEKDLLYKFAHSKDLWEKRIAILSTFTFIRHGWFDDTLNISGILLNDKHDLIHKAVGWMLREIGNRDIQSEEEFLIKHYKTMPRTMLRYAIEKFPEQKRKAYLKGTI
ncbi:MAG: DNA alkylation repair protein [Ignavibacterium sp.]|nr:DNA alkylation repair protein [Ignavibacterium sp.]HCY75471.1 DNA alkylation repair protein [Ignavibacteriales bacterium]